MIVLRTEFVEKISLDVAIVSGIEMEVWVVGLLDVSRAQSHTVLISVESGAQGPC